MSDSITKRAKAFSAGSNVIPLFPRGAHTMSAPREQLVFYLNEDNRYETAFADLGRSHVENIQSRNHLNAILLTETPDLVVCEAAIGWADIFQLIDSLHYLLEVPIVLLWDTNRIPRDERLLKQAYRAGASDILFTPLDEMELTDTLSLLLKYQRQILLNE